jgi:UDP-2-acetamido-3-amino-2,3-dideoxy-glucuronate N-acetyltransferase
MIRTSERRATRKHAPARRDYFVHRLALVESNEIGRGTRIWAFAHVMTSARVGCDCNIGEHAFIESGVVLGNNVTVKNGVAIWTGVTVEDDVFLGPNCVLTNDPNPRAYIKKPSEVLALTRIQTKATIGANATLLCGISIGRCAFVGAGAVVIRTVPDFALIVGNPARQIGWMCVCGQKLPMPAFVALGARCVCTYCQRSFYRNEEGLTDNSLLEKGTK